MEACSLNGVVFVVVTTILAVIVTGVISFFITRRQVKKQGMEIRKQLEVQYRNITRQVQAEAPVPLKQKQCDLTLEALQKYWGLLIYTTDSENPKSIVTYTVDKERKDGLEIRNHTYYFNRSNIERFFESSHKYFYEEGWGLYLSRDLKEKLFEYERKLWGLKVDGEKSGDENVQQIKSPGFAKHLYKLHDEMILVLQKDMKNLYDPK
jgi:uncharacterized protein YneF (UPF0154 family)